MKKRHLNNFAIIGLGMVGTAIGFLLKKAGYKIMAIADKSAAALQRAQSYTGGKAYRKPQEAVQEADCILITTPDDIILSVCKGIALSPAIKGKFVFHMSGAGGLDLLEPAKKAGAAVASIHPLQSFSSIDQAIQNIPESYFGITADKKAEMLAKNIVRDVGGSPLLISAAQKPLYHAAALTGPIARGDFGTVRKHIAAISDNLPQYASLYSSLGLLTVKIAQQKGTLDNRQAKKINDLLKGVINHEQSK
jgi:predicted short-subunit dehydrogenase-like oxidoreductase (DUF2520 family)